MKAILSWDRLYKHSSPTSPFFQMELIFLALTLASVFPLLGALPSGNSQ